MIYDYKNFLTLMAKGKNILVLDDGMLLKEHKPVLELFQNYFYHNVNRETINSLQGTLISAEIDLALIYTKDPRDIVEICQKIVTFDNSIVITAIVQKSTENLCHEIVKCADTILFPPFDDKDLYKQLSTALSAKLMMYGMSHTINTHKKFLDDTGIDAYLDTFEPDAKILADTLKGYALRLRAGELGEEIFQELASEIENVGKIFTYHHYTSHLVSIFDEMVAFLRTYEFDEIDISRLEGFDYLAVIVEDICNYLENFFVQRIFSDVYVFEHSLHDSIVFMINHLTAHETNSSDLEYF